ncbi:T-cell ecto-ADP-ribosyltransferase 2-like [Phyllostomus discolor]|uniref:NAD(P)(+)--arginine ADP-ribosyltransferase n=1 Tax=Phyllostomus discolor TaxID=89673 RepID=A0A6J2M505_9CHIR|nr:T-cell ecto-ADP-ribosyltransferase 2-like [Phyllostomus discolor]
MTCLLATEVCFLILTQWLTQQVSSLSQLESSQDLDMTDDAFDDQYNGCTEEMDKKAPQLLEKELEVNGNLKHEWEMAQRKWKEIRNKADPSKKLNDFQGTALVAYTGDIAMEFNKAIRSFHQNSDKFQFKAFHYYLTRALQLLTTGECHTVYRGTRIKFVYKGKGNVRFGQFAPSSSSVEAAKNVLFEKRLGTLFTIRTCLGVYIKNCSYYPSEKEVLIPGYEVFQQVTIPSKDKTYSQYSLTNDGKTLSKTHDEVSLESPQNFTSNYNCFYSSGMRQHPVFILLLPSLLVLLLLPAEL